MEEKSAQISTRTRSVRKPKKSQIPVALIVTGVVIAFGIYLGTISSKLPFYWIIGLGFGLVLQRARFCFTASLRDPSLTGSTSVTRAVLVGIGLATIGFTAIKFHAFQAGGESNLNMVNVSAIGVPLLIGGLLFGIGMVIAGGCASGTLMRTGEGFTMQLIALLFFVIGSLWGAHDVGAFWGKLNTNAPKIFLPDIFGWVGAIAVQGAIILLLYIACVKWQKKKMGSAE